MRAITLFLFLVIMSGRLFAAKDSIIYDMLGGSMVKHKDISNVVTVGAVPVISSFIFALRKGPVIKNALPSMFTRKAMTGRLYYIIATNASKTNTYTLADVPSSINLETLLKENPQLILTMEATTAKMLRDKGFNVACLLWRNESDAKKLMLFLGDVLEAKKQALDYNEYVDKVTSLLDSRVGNIPNVEKQKVLYMDYKGMNNPHLIADWWINKVGGISVTDAKRKIERHSFSTEQILVWNPDVIIVANPSDVDDIYNNKAMLSISAVRNKRVFASPSGLHLWANRTSEQPLMLIWAAKQIYPKYFSDLNIQKETKDFYSKFFNYELSNSDLNSILKPTR